jgi:hypothetical protein
MLKPFQSEPILAGFSKALKALSVHNTRPASRTPHIQKRQHPGKQPDSKLTLAALRMHTLLDGMCPLTRASRFFVTCTSLAYGLLRTWRLNPPSHAHITDR